MPVTAGTLPYAGDGALTMVDAVTQQWGGAPDQWQRGQAPWQPAFGGQQAPWPTQPAVQQGFPQQGYYPPQGYSQPQGYYQQQGTPPGYFPPPQPPRRRRTFFGTLVRAAFTIFLIMVAFSVVRGVLNSVLGGGSGGGTVQTRPPATTGTSSRPTAGTTTSSGSGTSGASGNSGTTTGGNGTTQYQNEGYQAPPADFNPPDLPQPTTYSQAQTWLTDNAIYAQNVPSPTNCTMTPIQAGLSKAQLEKRLNDLMACLMQVWEPPVQAAGFEMPRPPVTVYSSSVTTACGVMKEINASYCAGDQHVYYALSLLDALPSQVADTRYAPEDVIAHEFGHAVQARTGMLIADKALEQKASKADATVMSRRTEQQADCFSGLYVASVAQSQGLAQADLQNLVDMTYYLGDDVLSGDSSISGDHGLGKNRQAWFAKGVQTNQVAVCNTWTVPASQVR